MQNESLKLVFRFFFFQSLSSIHRLLKLQISSSNECLFFFCISLLFNCMIFLYNSAIGKNYLHFE